MTDKKTRTGTDEWIKQLVNNNKSEFSDENKVYQVLGYIKDELTTLKKHNKYIRNSKFNLRHAVHYLNTGGYKEMAQYDLEDPAAQIVSVLKLVKKHALEKLLVDKE